MFWASKYKRAIIVPNRAYLVILTLLEGVSFCDYVLRLAELSACPLIIGDLIQFFCGTSFKPIEI